MDNKMDEFKIVSGYNVAYKNASDLLSSNVDFFCIFPDFFLEVAQAENHILYEALKGEDFEKHLEDASFSAEMEGLIQKYLDEISEIEKECYKITIEKNLEDPLEFFQAVMSSPMLVNQIKQKIKAQKTSEQKNASNIATNKTTDQSSEPSPEM